MPSLSEPAVRRLAEAGRSGRLATIDPDGRPNIVPVVFVLDGDTLYSAVDQKPKTAPRLRRLENVRARPERVSVLIDHYEEDWPEVWWTRLRGRGRVIAEGPEMDRAHRLLRDKYPQYRDMPDGLGAVLAIDISEWRGWAWRSVQ
jgi:PPOX class probable F420-dependent enzyme